MRIPDKLYCLNGILSMNEIHGAKVYVPEDRLLAAMHLLDHVLTEDIAALTGYSEEKTTELLAILYGE